MSAIRFERLLKWYPSGWRARYGEELIALMEDTYGEGKLHFGKKLGIMRSGLAEHAREIGMGIGDRSPTEWLRMGSLRVLFAWAFFVIGGSALAKFSEHWVGQTPQAKRWIPVGAFTVVQFAGACGAGIVLIGAALAAPAFAGLLRDGHWAAVRRPIIRASVVVGATSCLTVGMIIWEHLRTVQHNGGIASHLIGSCWALLVAASVVTSTIAAASVTPRLSLSPTLLRLEGALALCLTLVMGAVSGGTLVWCVVVAIDAPAIISIHGGLFGVPGVPAMVGIDVLMITGLILALDGARRVGRSIRHVCS